PLLLIDSLPRSRSIVIAGTIGRSELIDSLIRSGKFCVDQVAGRWESFQIEVIDQPFPNIDKALVIAGSDKRGTIYGIYDVSERIGVSPWHWWADVPAVKHQSLYVKAGRFVQQEPKVRYRGIFINDEAPNLSGLVQEKFGGFNSRFYDRVFDLILRLKGNYLWPAMWGRSLFADDSLSAPLADEYGVVLGTSHHEPMVRSHVEWGRSKGPWNYEKNDSTLREFWRDGIRRMRGHETIVTVGMRGDGDEPMSEKANIALLEKIVNDQRTIISEITHRDPATVPQLWALYKEVQEYYDKGMRVPDDVTLLLCDDNWGNIRKLPRLTDTARTGGYGVYYHFDYVGGPRNYKWVNTNQVSRIWEQMHLAYEYGVRKIWIVNVGDIKPMELPTEFFLDYAWDPDAITADKLPGYTREWARAQFGAKYAQEIGQILTAYTTYNSRRKPELLSPLTFSLVNYREAERVLADYQALAKKARKIYQVLSSESKDAYYQLVLHPVEACSNLYELYITVGRNRLYAAQRRVSANMMAEHARELFARDSAISYYYNHTMAAGKWNHMMDQTHIGYTSWQQPEVDTMPNVQRLTVPDAPELGVAIEGWSASWPCDTASAVLPEFDRLTPHDTSYIELFNRGRAPFAYRLTAGSPYVHLSRSGGTLTQDQRAWITVDWKRVPIGVHNVPITITGANDQSVTVFARINNAIPSSIRSNRGYVEHRNYVSIEAAHYARAVSTPTVSWITIPSIGRTLSGVTPIPVTSVSQTPNGETQPHLEFQIVLRSTGEVKIKTYVSPTLNFNNTDGLRYAVSIDDEAPQMVNIHTSTRTYRWDNWVSDNVICPVSVHTVNTPGAHVIKYWMVDPGIVLQKLVVETGEVKPSYLGPPESALLNGSK
ncbi:MAG TPA: glycosyl hydrolase 115 family protein, partial [Bacteroidota bacterium]|nr:glycosyl hydrolase 115 family protein [Bacteroidota bacterium]